MSSQPPSTIFHNAAEELANEFARRQFRDSITDRDAAEYVTTQVAASWIAMELSDRAAQAVLSDLIFKLTDAEATNLLRYLLQQDGFPALVHLSRVMHNQIAHDLAYEAEQRAEGMEPTEAELTRDFYPNEVSDPVWNDRYATAREHNAGLRASRVIR